MIDVEIRELRTADELAALPAFERFVWGSDTEMVSVNMLVATLQEGGVALGAYLQGELVGMVYGFASREREVLHSHYLAVHPDLRGQGLGVALKERQRSWCLEHDFTVMRWTFDPLQLANAHLNLNRLGATGVAYFENLYGTLGGINGSLPSDRLLVRWDLAGDQTALAVTARVPVPNATPDDVARSTSAAGIARLAVREALCHHLGVGDVIVGVDLEAREYLIGRLA